MKALLQRVAFAQVRVDDAVVGEIQRGLLVYIGVGKDDDAACAKKMVDKILAYRVFENTNDQDKQGKMDKSLTDIGGELLLVSQFTLMARTDKGRRPDFGEAMAPVAAKALFEELVAYAKSRHAIVQTGVFGADMQVLSANDGPVNFVLRV